MLADDPTTLALGEPTPHAFALGAASEYSRHAWRTEHDAETAFASSESSSETG